MSDAVRAFLLYVQLLRETSKRMALSIQAAS